MIFTIQETGNKGELIAIDYLRKYGYEIIYHHFTTHWGELDIVAKKDRKIYFIEVKTRTSDLKGKPFEAINYYKIRAQKRAAEFFIQKFKLRNYKFTLDAISIVLNSDMSIKQLDYYENYL